jgi:activator of HSP90 ATPase
MSEILVHSNTFNAPIGRVFSAIANADQHGAFTGAPATGSNEPGTAFTTHDGAIEGWTLGAAANSYIVQAWRPTDWPTGVFSLVRYDFSADGDSTKITLTQSSMPDGAAPHLEQGWNERYWAPLAAYLAD